VGSRIAPDPAVRLLLLVARSRLGTASERELIRLVDDPVNWSTLVGFAESEGIAPLLHGHLRRLHLLGRLPSEAWTRLTTIANSVWGMNAALTEHWAEATTALERAGVETMTLKGIALAHTVYPEPGLRPMADIDLLVRPGAQAGALKTLLALGYRTPGEAADRHAASRSFIELVRGGARIDLHWHVARYLRFEGIVEIDQDGLWRRARPLVTPAGRSLALCPEDLLLHLIVHLTLGSDFARVLWYADIDAVIRCYATALDWESLIAEAERWRIRALVGWTLGVVGDAFDSPLPRRLIERLGRNGVRRAAVARCIGMSSPPSLGPRLGDTRVYLAQTLLMDRATDVLRVLVWSFFPSGTWLRFHYEIAAWWRVPVYRVIHPLRVCWLAARQLW
jgi:hypothetical protein